MRRRALLRATGGAVVALTGCADRAPRDATTTDAAPPTSDAEVATARTATPTPTTAARTTPDPALSLADHELVRVREGTDAELARVEGALRNDGETTVTNPTVAATFVDGAGEALDTARVDADALSPGATWAFVVTFPGAGDEARTVADYELSVGRG